MLDTLLKPLTTATSTGVAVRDITMIVGSILAILGILGLLTTEQIEALQQQIAILTDPKLLTAMGTLLTAGMSIYRIFFKATSDKAAEAAKQIDQNLAPGAPVVIETPEGQPNIVVQPK